VTTASTGCPSACAGVKRMLRAISSAAASTCAFPLDRAMRNTRVLVRRIAVSNYHHEPIPPAYSLLCEDLAVATGQMADELATGEKALRVRESLLRIGAGTAEVERVADLSADVVLAQIRSIIVDLLQITGMDVLEATDALPPPRL